MTGFVAVVGSANLDIVLTTQCRPEPGATVLGSGYREVPGGKGANQAIGAARVARCALIGHVGTDPAGALLIDTMANAGVATDGIDRSDQPTGRAVITLTPDGENSIIVLPLANSTVDKDCAVAHLARIRPDVVLTQLEIPVEVVQAVAGWTAQAGARFLLNPSPVLPLPDTLVSLADPLVLNTGEASALLANHDASAPELARQLAARARSAVVTAGPDGAYLAYDDVVMHTRGAPVARVVDTTGAGDAFAGTLAGHLANGRSLADSARLANAEAARVVQLERTNR